MAPRRQTGIFQILCFPRPFSPFRCDSTAKTKFTLDSAVLFPHFDSVVRRKQSLSWIPPFLLPHLLLWYGENRVFFLFRRLFFLVCLWKQQFLGFQPILLPSAFRLAYGSNNFTVFNLFCCLLLSIFAYGSNNFTVFSQFCCLLLSIFAYGSNNFPNTRLFCCFRPHQKKR